MIHGMAGHCFGPGGEVLPGWDEPKWRAEFVGIAFAPEDVGSKEDAAREIAWARREWARALRVDPERLGFEQREFWAWRVMLDGAPAKASPRAIYEYNLRDMAAATPRGLH